MTVAVLVLAALLALCGVRMAFGSGGSLARQWTPLLLLVVAVAAVLGVFFGDRLVESVSLDRAVVIVAREGASDTTLQEALAALPRGSRIDLLLLGTSDQESRPPRTWGRAGDYAADQEKRTDLRAKAARIDWKRPGWSDRMVQAGAQALVGRHVFGLPVWREPAMLIIHDEDKDWTTVNFGDVTAEGLSRALHRPGGSAPQVFWTTTKSLGHADKMRLTVLDQPIKQEALLSQLASFELRLRDDSRADGDLPIRWLTVSLRADDPLVVERDNIPEARERKERLTMKRDGSTGEFRTAIPFACLTDWARHGPKPDWTERNGNLEEGIYRLHVSIEVEGDRAPFDATTFFRVGSKKFLVLAHGGPDGRPVLGGLAEQSWTHYENRDPSDKSLGVWRPYAPLTNPKKPRTFLGGGVGVESLFDHSEMGVNPSRTDPLALETADWLTVTTYDKAAGKQWDDLAKTGRALVLVEPTLADLVALDRLQLPDRAGTPRKLPALSVLVRNGLTTAVIGPPVQPSSAGLPEWLAWSAKPAALGSAPALVHWERQVYFVTDTSGLAFTSLLKTPKDPGPFYAADLEVSFIKAVYTKLTGLEQPPGTDPARSWASIRSIAAPGADAEHPTSRPNWVLGVGQPYYTADRITIMPPVACRFPTANGSIGSTSLDQSHQQDLDSGAIAPRLGAISTDGPQPTASPASPAGTPGATPLPAPDSQAASLINHPNYQSLIKGHYYPNTTVVLFVVPVQKKGIKDPGSKDFVLEGPDPKPEAPHKFVYLKEGASFPDIKSLLEKYIDVVVVELPMQEAFQRSYTSLLSGPSAVDLEMLIPSTEDAKKLGGELTVIPLDGDVATGRAKAAAEGQKAAKTIQDKPLSSLDLVANGRVFGRQVKATATLPAVSYLLQPAAPPPAKSLADGVLARFERAVAGKPRFAPVAVATNTFHAGQVITFAYSPWSEAVWHEDLGKYSPKNPGVGTGWGLQRFIDLARYALQVTPVSNVPLVQAVEADSAETSLRLICWAGAGRDLPRVSLVMKGLDGSEHRGELDLGGLQASLGVVNYRFVPPENWFTGTAAFLSGDAVIEIDDRSGAAPRKSEILHNVVLRRRQIDADNADGLLGKLAWISGGERVLLRAPAGASAGELPSVSSALQARHPWIVYIALLLPLLVMPAVCRPSLVILNGKRVFQAILRRKKALVGPGDEQPPPALGLDVQAFVSAWGENPGRPDSGRQSGLPAGQRRWQPGDRLTSALPNTLMPFTTVGRLLKLPVRPPKVRLRHNGFLRKPPCSSTTRPRCASTTGRRTARRPPSPSTWHWSSVRGSGCVAGPFISARWRLRND